MDLMPTCLSCRHGCCPVPYAAWVPGELCPLLLQATVHAYVELRMLQGVKGIKVASDMLRTPEHQIGSISTLIACKTAVQMTAAGRQLCSSC
jgi:hypothetical protein